MGNQGFSRFPKESWEICRFSDVGWSGEYDCSNCKMVGKKTKTRFGLHTCSFRCEIKPISTTTQTLLKHPKHYSDSLEAL